MKQKKIRCELFRRLAIAKEPYELEREALLQTGAAALQAGVEGETRGAAATSRTSPYGSASRSAQQRAAMSRGNATTTAVSCTRRVKATRRKS